MYAFDPRRSAILLIGSNKAGKDRWYDQYVPIADKLYDDHLNRLLVAWIELHRDELQENWQRAIDQEPLVNIHNKEKVR